MFPCLHNIPTTNESDSDSYIYHQNFVLNSQKDTPIPHK